jgi:hypothetical protein
MSSHTGVLLLSMVFFLLLAVPLTALTWRIVKRSGDGTGALRGKGIIWLLAAFAFSALLLFRPHEHTFTGLDVSGYRLMAGALAEGRPLQGVDEALAELPRPVRSLVLFRPEHHKPTRDISFRIDSMETCRTRPFFYPTLPLSMVGFDLVIPGGARDYLVPAAGALFFCALIAVCVASAGAGGLLVGISFLLGSIYPVWFFRGSYPESIGTILVAMAMLSWVVGENEEKGPGYLESFCLGLAVTFHPLLAVLAVPALGAVVVAARSLSPWKTLLALLSFLAGTVPLLLLTKHVTSPYGQFTWHSVSTWWKKSPVMGAALLATAAAGALFLLALCFRGPVFRKISRIREGRPLLFSGLLALLLVAPTAAAALVPVHGILVQRGLHDLGGGMQIAFGALLLGSVAYVVFSRDNARLKILALVAAAALPALLYLKGAEDPNLWSQRRLLPFAVLAVTVAASAAAALLGRFSRGPRPGALRTAVIVLVLCAGLSNAVRWPAPYLVRQERGAGDWVSRLSEKFSDGMLLFDYHSYSVPFAVGGERRAFGLGSYSFKGMPLFMEWMAEAAREEPVYLMSAYAGGWMEQGVVPEEVGRETVTFQRVRGKRGLPAVRSGKSLDLRVIRVSPGEEGLPAVMEKVLDGSNFGLRPPWGRRDIRVRAEDGRRLRAAWSREGSGIVGPVPPPGGSVRLELQAAAARRDGSAGQVLKVVPPWGGRPLELTVGNAFTVASGLLARPAGSTGYQGATGVYRLYAANPYNPKNAGIKGFRKDLGALVHRVSMEMSMPEADRERRK